MYSNIIYTRSFVPRYIVHHRMGRLEMFMTVCNIQIYVQCSEIEILCHYKIVITHVVSDRMYLIIRRPIALSTEKKVNLTR